MRPVVVAVDVAADAASGLVEVAGAWFSHTSRSFEFPEDQDSMKA